MRAAVEYAGKPVGWLLWEPDGYGVQIEVDCEIPSGAPLLRCYGEIGGAPLLVGLPAPENGRLRLRRHLSKETLKVAGCTQGPPTAFYLAERPQQKENAVPQAEHPPQDTAPKISDHGKPPLRTGDAVLDALLDSGAVQAERIQEGLRLHCLFAPNRPFGLAPAFVLCRVEGDEAVLDWTKKDAASVAASDSEQNVT
ncbi:hypothetical protein [Candidatus Agathobaculum pullicola]|uniref:hypothetical protein n=1 Tax=Candidatus Agathobaculum pullicola TaxID=2838426 RepID=UPI003F8F82AA